MYAKKLCFLSFVVFAMCTFFVFLSLPDRRVALAESGQSAVTLTPQPEQQQKHTKQWVEPPVIEPFQKQQVEQRAEQLIDFREKSAKPSAQRIVSLAPALTELVFALGAQEQLVGRTLHCNYPEEAGQLPIVGTYYRPDLERIIQLEPDVCLAVTDGTPEYILARLEKIGIEVMRVNPTTLDELRETIFVLGTNFSKEEQAVRVIDTFDARRKELQQRVQGYEKQRAEAGVAQPRVAYQIQKEPPIYAGEGTFCNELILQAGGVNAITVKKQYPQLSKEEVLYLQPDVVLLSYMHLEADATLSTKLAQRVRGNAFSEYQKIYGSAPAINNSAVWYVEPDFFTRTTLRSLDALEVLIYILYVDL